VRQREKACLDGIEAAYRDRFHRFLHVAMAITSDVDLAADAVHEAFARAVRLHRSYRGSGSVEAWLWRIVVNVARDQARRVQEFASENEAAAAASELPVSDSARVREVLARLPERQRLVLFLRYYADLDYEAIGAALEISVGTVGATLHAAHAAVRAQMREVSCP
jgi:RNA polymerase sigma-70 factor (ECF subfamily)